MKRLSKIALALAVLLSSSAVVLSQGTITIQSSHRNPPRVSSLTIDWTASAAGVASTNIGHLSGELVRVAVVPTSGSTAPDQNYDITLDDSDSIDVLAGLGANLASNVTYNFKPGVEFTDMTITSVAPFCVDSVLTVTVTNAGNANVGTIRLFYK